MDRFRQQQKALDVEVLTNYGSLDEAPPSYWAESKKIWQGCAAAYNRLYRQEKIEQDKEVAMRSNRAEMATRVAERQAPKDSIIGLDAMAKDGSRYKWSLLAFDKVRLWAVQCKLVSTDRRAPFRPCDRRTSKVDSSKRLRRPCRITTTGS